MTSGNRQNSPIGLGSGQCPEDCDPELWRLFCASANGDLATVRQIIRDTPESLNSFVWYESPLHYAVRENHIEVARELLAAGLNPAYSNFTYSSWQSLLPIAKDRGFEELHDLLVREMQRRFEYAPEYETLWNAIAKGSVDDVKELVAAHPNLINVGDEHGNRPLHRAVLARRIPIIELLLDSGADINALRADMQSPLHLAIEGGDYWYGKKHKPDADTAPEQVIELLRERGAAYEFSDAVALNDLQRVKADLARNPELAKKLNKARRSPLYLAAGRGHMEMVRILLEHGADPNLAEHCAADGRALFSASSRNDIEMMSLLIEHGANADAYVDSCGNCLSIAQQGGERESEAVELLKQHGALPGEWELRSREKVSEALDDESFVPNRDMWSSVLGKILELDDVELLNKYVERFGADSVRKLNPAKGWRIPASKEMVSALINHGANINARDWFGRTYLHYLASKDWIGAVQSLIAAGIDIDAIDHESGTTALGFAARSGNTKMVEYLLDEGANARLPEAELAQPVTLAHKEGHGEIVELLRKRGSRQ